MLCQSHSAKRYQGAINTIVQLCVGRRSGLIAYVIAVGVGGYLTTSGFGV